MGSLRQTSPLIAPHWGEGEEKDSPFQCLRLVLFLGLTCSFSISTRRQSLDIFVFT